MLLIPKNLLSEKVSTAAEKTTMNSVKQVWDVLGIFQTSKSVLVHSQQIQWFQEALELLSMGIITVVLHTSGELGAPCPNSAQLGFTAHTQQIWLHCRAGTMAYGPFCHKEQVPDLLRQKIRKQIEHQSICSAYCTSFVKVKYTGVQSKDIEK